MRWIMVFIVPHISGSLPSLDASTLFYMWLVRTHLRCTPTLTPTIISTAHHCQLATVSYHGTNCYL